MGEVMTRDWNVGSREHLDYSDAGNNMFTYICDVVHYDVLSGCDLVCVEMKNVCTHTSRW